MGETLWKTKAEAENYIRKRKKMLKKGKAKLKTDPVYKNWASMRKKLEKGFDDTIKGIKIKKISYLGHKKIYYKVID